jgi:MFS family permease
VYGALGVSTFLFVLYLQEVLDYSPLESGAALLPMTVLMLALSGRSGQLADRIGTRTPMIVGPLLMAVGFLLMLRVSPTATYVGTVLPAVVVLGLGLVATVAPLTATVLSSVEDRHAGVASGVNNAVARSAQLVAVAGIPLAAGITGDAYRDPVAFNDGFTMAMWISAVLAASGSVLAALTIRTPAKPVEPAKVPRQVPAGNTHCALEAPPLSNCPGIKSDVTDDAA